MASKPAKGSAHYKPEVKEEEFIDKTQPGIITVKPNGLKVIWGNDPRCWKQTHDKGPFELIQVAWLEVSGAIKMSNLVKKTTYSLRFNVKVNDEAFGFENCPVYVMAKLPGGDLIWKKVDIQKLKNGVDTDIPDDLTFQVPDSLNDSLIFGLFDIWSGTWKGGLVINSVKIVKA